LKKTLFKKDGRAASAAAGGRRQARKTMSKSKQKKSIEWSYDKNYIRAAPPGILTWSDEKDRIQSRRKGKDDVYQCLHCENSYDTIQSLRKHFRSAHEWIRYQCPFQWCEEESTRLQTLRYHVEKLHNLSVTVVGDHQTPPRQTAPPPPPTKTTKSSKNTSKKSVGSGAKNSAAKRPGKRTCGRSFALPFFLCD
jgi:hypothetical protein